MSQIESVELCAGGGGQALGLEQAGFSHSCLVEFDQNCVTTLRHNRKAWNVVHADLKQWSGEKYKGADLLAAGLPCPPFSKAGKQLGSDDERNLFPTAIRIIDEVRPKCVLVENVRGILDAVFDDFRGHFQRQVESMGYAADWRLLNASDFGVPQLRPRVVFVALQKRFASNFSWPETLQITPRTVGETLFDLMASREWLGVKNWKRQANEIAPTLVGGSLKHGGPDLGPTRAKLAWAKLGVDGHGIADEPPGPDFVGMPKLTVRMCARLQGFPDKWAFPGRKTTSYRQIGNAFPPPVARAVAEKLKLALSAKKYIRFAA